MTFKRETVYLVCAVALLMGALAAAHAGEWRAFAFGFLGAAGFALALAEVKP